MKTALIAAAAVATLTGFVAAPASAAEVEIRNAVANDQMKYNGLGLLIGAVIAMIFYRRFSLMLLTAMC